MATKMFNLSRSLFGYDLFIAYAWADGRIYAVLLRQSLEQAGIRCSIDDGDGLDESGFQATDNLQEATVRNIQASRALVLVGSKKALTRPSVLFEIDTCIKQGVPIVPISIDGALENPDGSISEYLPAGALVLKESNLESPSENVISRIAERFQTWRRQRIRQQVIVSVGALMSLLGALAVVFGIQTFIQASKIKEEATLLLAEEARDPLVSAQALVGLSDPSNPARAIEAGLQLLENPIPSAVVNEQVAAASFGDKILLIATKDGKAMRCQENLSCEEIGRTSGTGPYTAFITERYFWFTTMSQLHSIGLDGQVATYSTSFESTQGVAEDESGTIMFFDSKGTLFQLKDGSPKYLIGPTPSLHPPDPGTRFRFCFSNCPPKVSAIKGYGEWIFSIFGNEVIRWKRGKRQPSFSVGPGVGLTNLAVGDASKVYAWGLGGARLLTEGSDAEVLSTEPIDAFQIDEQDRIWMLSGGIIDYPQGAWLSVPAQKNRLISKGAHNFAIGENWIVTWDERANLYFHHSTSGGNRLSLKSLPVRGVVTRPDGAILAWSKSNARLWLPTTSSLPTRKRLLRKPHNALDISSIFLSPNGNLFVANGMLSIESMAGSRGAHPVQIRQAPSGARDKWEWLRNAPEPQMFSVYSASLASFSKDGSLLAIVDQHFGNILLIDLALMKGLNLPRIPHVSQALQSPTRALAVTFDGNADARRIKVISEDGSLWSISAKRVQKTGHLASYLSMASFEGDRIWAIQLDGSFGFYEDARWTDVAPRAKYFATSPNGVAWIDEGGIAQLPDHSPRRAEHLAAGAGGWITAFENVITWNKEGLEVTMERDHRITAVFGNTDLIGAATSEGVIMTWKPVWAEIQRALTLSPP